jgi:NAD(P)H dehydrogenase (quinone)
MKKAGLPDMMVQRIYGFYSDIREGLLDGVSADMEILLGRNPLYLRAGLSTMFNMQLTRH